MKDPFGSGVEHAIVPALTPDIGYIHAQRCDEKGNIQMYLASYHLGLSVAEVKANMDWDLKVATDVCETERPSPELIRILGGELDPTGVFLKKK